MRPKPAGLGPRPIWRLAASTLLPILALAALSSSAGAGAPDFTFLVKIGDSCVSGYGPVDVDVDLTLRTAGGDLKAAAAAHSDGSGRWNSDPCFTTYMDIGDRIGASDGSSSRTFTIPKLTVRTNRLTDRVTGKGPPDSSLTLDLETCYTYPRCDLVTSVERPVDGRGRYATDLTATHDTKGADRVTVAWSDAAGDEVSVRGIFPYVNVQRGQSGFTGYANRGQLTKLVLLTRAGVIRGTGRAVASGQNGYLFGDFRDGDGAPVYVRASDKVRPGFAGGVTFSVPRLNVTGQADSDMVTGACGAHHPFEVYAHPPSYPFRPDGTSRAQGTTNDRGRFAVDMSNADYPLFDLMPGDQVELACRLGAGDEVGAWSLVP